MKKKNCDWSSQTISHQLIKHSQSQTFPTLILQPCKLPTPKIEGGCIFGTEEGFGMKPPLDLSSHRSQNTLNSSFINLQVFDWPVGSGWSNIGFAWPKGNQSPTCDTPQSHLYFPIPSPKPIHPQEISSARPVSTLELTFWESNPVAIMASAAASKGALFADDVPWRASPAGTKPVPRIHQNPVLRLPQNSNTSYALAVMKVIRTFPLSFLGFSLRFWVLVLVL